MQVCEVGAWRVVVVWAVGLWAWAVEAAHETGVAMGLKQVEAAVRGRKGEAEHGARGGRPCDRGPQAGPGLRRPSLVTYTAVKALTMVIASGTRRSCLPPWTAPSPPCPASATWRATC